MSQLTHFVEDGAVFRRVRREAVNSTDGDISSECSNESKEE